MLAPSIYRDIYEAARTRPAADIVEIGTADGAATIALALGLRDSGKPGVVHTFDRCKPGNTAQSNFAAFGVEALIRLYQGEAEATAANLPADTKIGLLMLDADGRIDRDFRAFYFRVLPGAPVIIDDCRDRVRIRSMKGGYRVDCKMQLCHDLVSYYVAKGVIAPGRMMKDTFFTSKVGDIEGLDPLDVLAAYQRLVFTEAAHPFAEEVRSSAVSFLDRFAPSWSARLRARYRDEIVGRAPAP